MSQYILEGAQVRLIRSPMYEDLIGYFSPIPNANVEQDMQKAVHRALFSPVFAIMMSAHQIKYISKNNSAYFDIHAYPEKVGDYIIDTVSELFQAVPQS